jgi:hypothetical protein
LDRRQIRLRAGAVFALSALLYVLFFRVMPQRAGVLSERQSARFERIENRFRGRVDACAWNAGGPGYVARDYSRVRVINLDGLVNNAAFEAAESGRYCSYVMATCDILLEPPRQGAALAGKACIDQLTGTFSSEEAGYWVNSGRAR